MLPPGIYRAFCIPPPPSHATYTYDTCISTLKIQTYQIAPKIAIKVACTSDPTTFRHLCLDAPAYFSGTGMKLSPFSDRLNSRKPRKDTRVAHVPGSVYIANVWIVTVTMSATYQNWCSCCGQVIKITLAGSSAFA